MDWLAPSVFASIAIALTLASIASRRIRVGPSGDWVVAWIALTLRGVGLEFPVADHVGEAFAAFATPLFAVMLLSGAFRYANRPVPRTLEPLAFVLGVVGGTATLIGNPITAHAITLAVLPFLCAFAAGVVVPAAARHGTILQQLLAPGLVIIGLVLAIDGFAGIAAWGSWDPVTVWLVAGLPIGTLQFAGVFELVGQRLTQTSLERDRNAAALARTVAKLQVAHSDMEARVAERTAQLREEIGVRRKVEAALRDNEAHYRKVTSLMTDFNYAARARHDGSREVVWLSGNLPDDLTREDETKRRLGRLRWHRLIVPEDRDEMAACAQRAMAGELAEFEVRLAPDPHHTGEGSEEVRWVRGRMMSEPIGDDGDMMLYATGRDVTAEIQAEREYERMRDRVREGQRLESLGALARGVAHDFNNLLNVILGNAAIISEDVVAGSPLRERADRIRRSARYAADIASQMLTYSGTASVTPEPIDLTALVSEMSELIESGTGERLALELKLDSELPRIRGDRAQLRQVILNLITNASEAMGEAGGRLQLHTGLTRVDERPVPGLLPGTELEAGEYVYLEVEDNGPGLDEETRARVFDPFFSTKLSGRGLGLAVVHGIARAHDAAIALTSEPGVGTRFRVFFPVLSSSAGEASEQDGLQVVEAAAVGVAGSILVIDDDDAIRELAEVVLHRAGYDVLVASGGIEGVELFSKNREKIAAVLVDIWMPDLAGDVVLERIRELNPDVPAIVSSGYADKITRDRIACEHRVRILSKPYEPGALIDCMRDLLRESQPR